MKVVIATGHDPGYNDLAAITIPSVRRYVQKWAQHVDLYYDPNRPAGQADACKILMYEELVQSGRFGPDDVYVWLDTDLLVMNSNVRLDHIIYHHMPRSIHFMIGVDPNGLNSGVYAARFTPEAARFLRVSRTISVAMGWG